MSGGHKFGCQYTLKPTNIQDTFKVSANDLTDAVYRCVSRTYDKLESAEIPLPLPVPEPLPPPNSMKFKETVDAKEDFGELSSNFQKSHPFSEYPH